MLRDLFFAFMFDGADASELLRHFRPYIQHGMPGDDFGAQSYLLNKLIMDKIDSKPPTPRGLWPSVHSREQRRV